jgi:threonine aldolase
VKVVDLRSDTVTKPTAEMRRAMAEAEVGDDVYGEDPTTNSLQERVAELFGKDAALFVTSGSMGNLVAFRCHTEPGDEVICHEGAHFLHFEVGSLAAVAGVQVRPLRGNKGVLDPEDVIAAIRPKRFAFPRSRVIAVENTNNFAGGAIYPIDDLRAARKVADEYGLALHLDGARIFNASVATGIPVSEYAALADTLTFCFSKGLGCPVGSILVGSQEVIEKARRYRQMHGGGMRQSGVLTAACHVALDSMIDRLAEDHANAKRLAEGIAAIQPEAINPDDVETNLVLVTTAPLGFTPAEFSTALEEEGVLFGPHATGFVRLAIHLDVSSDDIDFVLEKIEKVMRAG